MLELRLSQGSLLKKVTEAIKDLVSNANFHCDAAGLSLQAMDSSHVALVSLLLPPESFDHYRCDRSVSLGVNIGNLAKVLKAAENDDIVTVKVDEGGDYDSVDFIFQRPDGGKVTNCKMKLMDIDSEHLGIPEAQYDAVVRMSSAEFAKTCNCLSSFGDTVIVFVTNEGACFSTSGDIGPLNMNYKHNSSIDKPEEARIIEMQRPVSQKFALRYMNSFTKATPLSDQVTISLKSELPVVVEYKIASIGYIRYYLAPKMEDSDGEAEV